MSASFPVLADLPAAEQKEVARIQAIASAQRKANETAYLNARSAYTANTIIESDSSGNILRCSSNAAPTNGGSGFAKACQWINTAAGSGNNGHYVNAGTTSSAVWQQVTSA